MWGVLTYLYNLLLHSLEVEEHITLVQHILQAHHDSGILLKAAKTRFFQKYVEYLGYGVTAEGVHLTGKAVELIKAGPATKTGAELPLVMAWDLRPE